MLPASDSPLMLLYPSPGKRIGLFQTPPAKKTAAVGGGAAAAECEPTPAVELPVPADELAEEDGNEEDENEKEDEVDYTLDGTVLKPTQIGSNTPTSGNARVRSLQPKGVWVYIKRLKGDNWPQEQPSASQSGGVARHLNCKSYCSKAFTNRAC